MRLPPYRMELALVATSLLAALVLVLAADSAFARNCGGGSFTYATDTFAGCSGACPLGGTCVTVAVGPTATCGCKDEDDNTILHRCCRLLATSSGSTIIFGTAGHCGEDCPGSGACTIVTELDPKTLDPIETFAECDES